MFVFTGGFRVFLIAAIALLWGCSSVRIHDVGPELATCFARFEAENEAIDSADAAEPYPVRVPGYPFLRVDRFFAEYAERSLSDAQKRDWIAALFELDRRAREIELRRLGRSETHEKYQCLELFTQHVLAHSQDYVQFKRSVHVPDAYSMTKRVVGLYPLSKYFMLKGVERWQAEQNRIWSERGQSADSEPGQAIRLYEFERGSAFSIESPIVAPALGLDEYSTQHLRELVAKHAPVWQIETQGDYDFPGELYIEEGMSRVGFKQPSVYIYSSWGWFNSHPILQLNYLIWFSQRPKESWGDLLGGHLDGIHWRVNLDEDGLPLFYDSIHPCGCYHRFYLTERVEWISNGYVEMPFLAPQNLDSNNEKPIVVSVSSGEHMVTGVHIVTDEFVSDPYQFVPYEALLLMGSETGERLFGGSGIIASSIRGERWLFWPMGIESAGAMRQRGTHATAFVGRRHFDDADLFDRLMKKRME